MQCFFVKRKKELASVSQKEQEQRQVSLMPPSSTNVKEKWKRMINSSISVQISKIAYCVVIQNEQS